MTQADAAQAVTLAQITDTHIRMGSGGHIDGPAAEDALRRAVAHLNALSAQVGGVDAVIHTGDLTDEGRPEEYDRFKALMEDLAPPLYAIPGNHDAREAMRAAGLAPAGAAAEGPMYAALDLGATRALLLDSVIPGESGGRLGEEQIAWAAAEIDAAAADGRPALVFAHHPPFTTGVGYMDAIRLEDGAALAAMLAERPSVRLFGCGHHHRLIHTIVGGAPAIAAPSTVVQLDLDFRAGEPPRPTGEQGAVMLHVWRPDMTRFGGVSSYLSAF